MKIRICFVPPENNQSKEIDYVNFLHTNIVPQIGEYLIITDEKENKLSTFIITHIYRNCTLKDNNGNIEDGEIVVIAEFANYGIDNHFISKNHKQSISMYEHRGYKAKTIPYFY